MDNVVKFFLNNYDWLFSGILSSLIFYFVGNKAGYNKAIKQTQSVKNNSSGIQVGGNYIVNGDRDE